MRLSPLVLTSLAFAPSLLAQRFPEIEPNGTAATAQAVALGSQIDANLAAGEQDWYSFTVASNTRVRIHTSQADTRIALLDAAGTTYLGIDDDARTSTNGFSSEIAMNLAAGSYTVQVVGFTSSTTGLYSLDIATLTPFVYNGNEVEPNDTHLTATPAPLAVGGGATRYHGNIGPATTQLTDAVAASTTVLSDVVLSSTTTVITATAPLVASAYVPGHSVQMTSGVNVGLIRAISSNTATTITTAAWPVANGVGDTYNVITNSTTTLIRPTSALTAGAWTPATAGFGRFYVRFTSGANAGVYRQITANTASTITCSAFAAAPAASDTFVVELCDVDYWQVVLTAPTQGLWFQITEGDAPWVYGHRYEVYDAAGALLLPTSSTTVPAFGANNANAGTLVARTSQVRVWPAGTYYLAVRSPAAPFAAGSTMPNGLIPTGNYLLELFSLPMDTGGVAVESEAIGGPNTNNTAATATPLAPGQIGQGNITLSTGTDPSDWWGPIVLNSRSPATISYQTRDGASPALLDSTINLRDSTGAIVNTVTGGNILDVSTSTAGLHGRQTISFYLTPATYYIEVLSPGTTAAVMEGNYELQLSALIPAPYTAASFANFTSNGPACYGSTAFSGSVVSSTTTVITTSGLVASAYIDGSFSVRMTSGANSGLVRLITANTATTITTPAWPVANAASDTFVIVRSATLTRQFASEVPALGATFARQLIGAPASAIYVHMLGFSNTLFGGSVPLPVDLTAIGAPGCTLNIDPVLLTIGTTDANGAADLVLQLPPNVAFRGAVWHEQAVVNNPAANAFGVQLSNHARAIVGERTY